MKPPMDPNLGEQSANFFPDRVALPEVTVVQYLQDEPGREKQSQFLISAIMVENNNMFYDSLTWW